MHDVNAVPEVANRVILLNKTIVADGTTSEVFSDVSLLEENNLDIPDICKIFSILGCYGCACDALPLTFHGAARVLDDMIEKNGGTVFLKCSETTDEKATALIQRFNPSR